MYFKKLFWCLDDDSCYKTEAAISETKAFLQVHALSVCKFNSTRKSDEIIDNNAHNKLKISDKLKRYTRLVSFCYYSL